MKPVQLGFYMDSKKCIGCFSCAMACKNQYHTMASIQWRCVYPLDNDIHPHRNRSFCSLACHHCRAPACVAACPVRAYTKRDIDGVVIHTQERCIGCQNCIRACPFGAPRYNPILKKAEKCSLCWQRLDAGLQPACVMACPVEALVLIDLLNDDLSAMDRFPAGFPEIEQLDPSVRFVRSGAPAPPKEHF
jgi:Fe-S-cluster-containing dehydrogenase component